MSRYKSSGAGGEFNGPVTIGDRIDMVILDGAPKHEESGEKEKDNSKYVLPRWCPAGLTCTQKRKLQ